MTKEKLLAPCAVVAWALVLVPAATAQRPEGVPPIVASATVNDPVTLTESVDRWTLNNGIVKVTILKSSGNPVSIVYRGIEALTRGNSWEQVPSGTVTAQVTIDPQTNGGKRAEVSVKGINPGGQGMVAGSGDGMDIETRYAVERGTSGFYTYAQYTHRAIYPTAQVGESRFILEELNPTFDWMSVDADRNMLMSQAPENVRVHAKEQSIYTSGLYKNSVEHKYSYAAQMYKLAAWGWSSTKDHIGVYFINPSNEYIGGGPEKLDLDAHLSAPGLPAYRANILDYWVSGHYAGGDTVVIPMWQPWRRVVGPIFVYFNQLAEAKTATPAELQRLAASSGSGNPEIPEGWRENSLALWRDALEMSTAVKAAWPFGWVEEMDYPHRRGRGKVTGQLVLEDRQAASKLLPHLNVGLTHANYRVPATDVQQRAGNGDIVTWPHDGTYYQFWTEGSEKGRFTIANVRPGTYTLHAFADGVLGEYAAADVVVEAGKDLDLGKLSWEPARYGRQIWEIGYPDRTGDKFFKGDGANYWLWGWGLRYSGLFPHDVTYTIGQSDYRQDWFFEEVPHSETTAWLNPAAEDPYNQRFGWVAIPAGSGDPWAQWGQGRATTWTVKFNLDRALKGMAVLRVALAGADGNGGLAIGVNGQAVGTLNPVATNALRYNTNKGAWYQYLQRFDAALLRQGENKVTFTVPAGDVTTGVVWDYIRLELNDGTGGYPTPPDGPRPDYPTVPGAGPG